MKTAIQIYSFYFYISDSSNVTLKRNAYLFCASYDNASWLPAKARNDLRSSIEK